MGAKALGLNLLNPAATQELFDSYSTNGNAELDHSGLVTALERMSNSKVNDG